MKWAASNQYSLRRIMALTMKRPRMDGAIPDYQGRGRTCLIQSFHQAAFRAMPYPPSMPIAGCREIVRACLEDTDVLKNSPTVTCPIPIPRAAPATESETQ